MKQAVVLETDDVKKIIAKYFGVDPKNVIKSQYTFTVVKEEETEQETE